MAANVNARPSVTFGPNVRIKTLVKKKKAVPSKPFGEFCPEHFSGLRRHAHVGLTSPIEKVEETYH